MDQINDWQEVSASPGTAAPAASATTASPAIKQNPNDPGDWQEVSRIPTDPTTGSPVPLGFSGLSPETAQNKGIVSGIDRLKMSVGNEAGNIKFLKSKFADVRPIMDAKGKPSHELAVQKDGSWYRVDPINGEIADPWEKAQEYVKDLADVAPMVAGAGIMAGVTALSGGAAAPAATSVLAGAETGAGIGALRTSLGRLVGTYDATPREQAWDIGLESLLNAAGVKIAAGVKPTATWMADKIKPLAAAFGESGVGQAAQGMASGAGNLAKDAMKKIFAGYSVGVENFDTMLDHPEAVKATMKNASARAGRNIEAYHDDITMNQMNQMKEFADSARGMLSQLYSRGRNEVLAAVDPSFTANFDKPIAESYRNALTKGIAKLDLGEGEALYGKDALEALARNPTLRGVDFKLLSQDEMKQAIRGGAELSNDLGYLSTNADAHATVSSFYKQVSDFSNSAERKGVNAAKDLLNFKRLATDRAYDLANADHIASMPGVKRILDEARAGIDNTIYQSLNDSGKGAGEKFLQLNKTYSELSNELVPVLNAKNQFSKSGDIKVYQGLLNQFLAKPGKNISTKYAVDQAIDAAEAYGLRDVAEELSARKTAVQVGEAAKAFNPVQPGWSKASNTMQAGLGVYALASHNPAMLAAVAGQAALRSPQTAGAAAATVRGLAAGQEMLSLMKPVERLKFMADPRAIQSFITGVTSAPLVYQQTSQQLNGAIQGAMQPPQQGQGQ